jgi:Ala-tRNA(Pro) deacylase
MNGNEDTYDKIIGHLEENSVPFRVIDHAPEGRTDVASQIRGNRLSQAAKAIVIKVKIGKKGRRYLLAVVPGDRRLNLEAVRALVAGASHVMFAPSEIATELTGCEMGAVPPFSFHDQLELVVDPSLLLNDEIVFNAGRLDKSIYVDSQSYARLASPRLVSIVQGDSV